MKSELQDAPGDTTPPPQEDGRGLAVRARRLWQCPIDGNLANLPLLACCLVTGLLDTTMFQGKRLSVFLNVFDNRSLLYPGLVA